MFEQNPQSLNDDFVRTWTISSVPFSSGDNSPGHFFEVTIKKKEGSFLFDCLTIKGD